MKYIIILGIVLIGLIGFGASAKYAVKSNYPRDYIKVWGFAAIAAVGMLSLFFV